MALKKSSWGEYGFVMLALMLGVSASLTLSWSYRQSRDETVRSAFDQATHDRIEVLRRMLDENRILLDTAAAFFSSSKDDVTRPEFSGFMRQLLKDHPSVQAVEWVPVVAGPQREAYERRQKTGLPGFSFTERAKDGLVPAARRGEYYPIYYVEPVKGNEPLAGYDLASDPDIAPVLAAARDARAPQASGLFHELMSAENVTGVLFAAPVYAQREAVAKSGKVVFDALEGFVVTIVSLPSIVEAALAPLHAAGINIVLQDVTKGEENPVPLYIHPSVTSHDSEAKIMSDLAERPRLSTAALFDAGGRKWRALLLPSTGSYMEDSPLTAYAILIGGLAFTALLAFYMLARIREHERVSLEVADRTREVAQQKKRFETILLSTHEGIVGVDASGAITFCNPGASTLTGFSKRELLGREFGAALVEAAKEPPDAGPSPQGPLSAVLQDGRVLASAGLSFRRREGEPFQAEFTASPLFEGEDVSGAVVIFKDITERKALERQLEHMARHDQLTGLANRALLAEHLKKALFRAERSGRRVGMLYCDLNDFKPVNDKFGHAAGDMILKAFSGCLARVSRDYDTPARMGGDEFALMADNLADKAEAYKIVDRLLEELRKPVEIDGHEFFIKSSIGIAFFPDDAPEPEALVRCADAAMYKAKKDKSLKYAVYAAKDEARPRKDEPRSRGGGAAS
jgi:diguanylate cyclase (GGDEF)-like protein/PAS domain S-box-containing protein